MEIQVSKLSEMSTKERKRFLDDMARVATAHREKETILTTLLRFVGGLFAHRRVSR